MPFPALYGMTLNDYQQAMDKEEALDKIRSKNVKQMNARIDQKDVKLFYQCYLSLLGLVNSKEQVVPDFVIRLDSFVDLEKLNVVIDYFWPNKEKWIDMYIKENPLKLTPKNLKIVENFKYGIRKEFVVVAFKKRHTIFNDGKFNYMVKGLNANIDEIIYADELPVYVRTTLLPFKEDIIYDSVLGTSEISIGPNAALKIFEDYVDQPKVYRLPNEKGGN